MSEKNLVICDSEFQYASNLMENIAERRELAVKAYACTTWEKVKLLSSEKKIHILIVDETCPGKEREKVKADQVFVLTTGNCRDLQKEEKSIYKYQCVDQILAEIFEAYFERTNEDIMKRVKKEHLKQIAVYSPVHRAGKTTFAIALGKELAKRKKVLYLNLEGYSGFGQVFQREDSGNLGDALYYTKQENSNFGMRLSMMVKRMDELEYIPPVPVCCDLKEVTFEEWELLIGQISENSIYEVIILDLGESVQGLFQILRLCDRIYMPVLEDEVSKEKLMQYEENMNELGMEEVIGKTEKFAAPQNIGEYVRLLVKEEKI